MAETSGAPGTASVADHRPVPRGVLPRGTQTWLMVGLAVGILFIILIAGRPEPAARPVSASTPVQAPTAERVRDYQDRLRMLEARTAQDAQSASAPSTAPLTYEESRAPAPEDSIKAEKRRREYESLFASNVVISRRPESDRPDSGRPAATAVNAPAQRDENPSIDDIADAVVR